MKALIKEAAARALSGLGLPARLHRRACPESLSILMYHAVVERPPPTPDWCFLQRDRFAAQMEYLARAFDVLPLSEAVARLRSGRIARPTAAITFDDGFQNNCDIAFPVLKRLGLPATIYLTTGLVDSADTVWFCRIDDALAKSRRKTLHWNGRHLELGSARRRGEAAGLLQQALKRLPHQQLLEQTGRILEALEVDPREAVARHSPYRMLDAESIRAMAGSGLVEFGAHTHSHAILTGLTPARQGQEMALSIAETGRLSGRPCRHFAYPNGQRGDFDGNAREYLAGQGIETAVTTLAGPNTPHTAPLELRRYGIGAGLSGAQFRSRVHHVGTGWRRSARHAE